PTTRPAANRAGQVTARIIGMAEGNIIATIMTRRSAKNRARSVDVMVDGAIRAMRKSADVHVAYHAAPTTTATAAATGMVMRSRSDVGSAEMTFNLGTVL